MATRDLIGQIVPRKLGLLVVGNLASAHERLLERFKLLWPPPLRRVQGRLHAYGSNP
jgi:hypothetical protein